MLKVFYKGSTGIVEFDNINYYLNVGTDLLSYEWKPINAQYADRIESFSMSMVKKTLSIGILALRDEDFAELNRRINAIFDYDVRHTQPGRLYVGNQYLVCYFIKSALGRLDTLESKRKNVVLKPYTLIAEDGQWRTDDTISLAPAIDNTGKHDAEFKGITIETPVAFSALREIQEKPLIRTAAGKVEGEVIAIENLNKQDGEIIFANDYRFEFHQNGEIYDACVGPDISFAGAGGGIWREKKEGAWSTGQVDVYSLADAEFIFAKKSWAHFLKCQNPILRVIFTDKNNVPLAKYEGTYREIDETHSEFTLTCKAHVNAQFVYACFWFNGEDPNLIMDYEVWSEELPTHRITADTSAGRIEKTESGWSGLDSGEAYMLDKYLENHAGKENGYTIMNGAELVYRSAKYSPFITFSGWSNGVTYSSSRLGHLSLSGRATKKTKIEIMKLTPAKTDHYWIALYASENFVVTATTEDIGFEFPHKAYVNMYMEAGKEYTFSVEIPEGTQCIELRETDRVIIEHYESEGFKMEKPVKVKAYKGDALVDERLICEETRFPVVMTADADRIEATQELEARAFTSNADSALEFLFDAGFDLGSDVVARAIVNDTVEEADFRMKIYGPCTDPTVIIAGHQYRVKVSVGSGEILEIDSAAQTVKKILVKGEQNCFAFRDRDNYIFKKIPIGKSEVIRNGAYAMDITLITYRSEPEWWI